MIPTQDIPQRIGSPAVRRSLRRNRFLAAGAGALAVANLVRGAEAAAQFQVKWASNLAVTHPSTTRSQQMWDTIEKESGGRIHAQLFPNSQLGGDTAMFSQLREGALEFFLIGTGNFASVVPSADISNLGFVYKDDDEVLQVMDGPVGAYIQKEALTKGIYKLRTTWDSGMQQISSSSHPIRTPADFRNFKIRVMESKMVIELFRSLGASPTPLSVSEMYTGMQTKIIDGTAISLVSLQAAKFYEVQKYVSLANVAWSGDWLIANGQLWNSLPPDLQAIVERNNNRYALIERNDTKALNASLQAMLEREGLTFNAVDQTPFRAQLRSYYQQWATVFGQTEWGLLEGSLRRKLV